MATQFYSYLWLREDGTPWYVGKGSGKRAYERHKGHWAPKDRSRILVLNRNSEQEAFDTEIELIRNWGRKDIGTGVLHNHTDGGEGHSGYVPTAEHREKVRRKSMGNKSFLGHTHPPEWSEQMSKNQTGDNRPYRLGIPHTPEARARISKALEGNKYRLGIPHTEETKQQQSKSMKGRKKSAETRARMIVSWTPERRARRAEETRKRMKEKFLKTVAWG
jgi:hypothetical protein